MCPCIRLRDEHHDSCPRMDPWSVALLHGGMALLRIDGHQLMLHLHDRSLSEYGKMGPGDAGTAIRVAAAHRPATHSEISVGGRWLTLR